MAVFHFLLWIVGLLFVYHLIGCFVFQNISHYYAYRDISCEFIIRNVILCFSLVLFDINVIFSSFCFSWNWYFYAIILLATQNTNKTMSIARMQPNNWLKLWREYAQKRRNRLRNRRNIFIQLFLKSVDNNLEIEQQFSYSFYWCLIIYS